MFKSVRNTLAALAVLAAAAAGGSALAGAASDDKSSSSSSTSSARSSDSTRRPPHGPGGPGGRGHHEEPLTGETAKRVEAAATAKVKGTVLRVETDADHGSPYEAHIRKSDGTEVEVLVNKDFEVTATNEMGPRR